jgi:hypothetical protein
MKIKTLIGLLLVDFLQTACVNNAQKTECVDNVQKTEQTKNDEPIVSIIDETSDPDSVYSSCSKKFADLMKHPDEKHFFELENEVRLGELTFTPMNSFFLCNNIEQEIELGKEIIIKN